MSKRAAVSVEDEARIPEDRDTGDEGAEQADHPSEQVVFLNAFPSPKGQRQPEGE